MGLRQTFPTHTIKILLNTELNCSCHASLPGPPWSAKQFVKFIRARERAKGRI
jgi:hypothetical protein